MLPRKATSGVAAGGEMIQVEGEVADDAVHGHPGYRRLSSCGRIAQRLLAHVEGHEPSTADRSPGRPRSACGSCRRCPTRARSTCRRPSARRSWLPRAAGRALGLGRVVLGRGAVISSNSSLPRSSYSQRDGSRQRSPAEAAPHVVDQRLPRPALGEVVRRTAVPPARGRASVAVIGVRLRREPHAGHRPARRRREEVAVRRSDVTGRGDARAAAQHHLARHELAVVLADRTLGLGRTRGTAGTRCAVHCQHAPVIWCRPGRRSTAATGADRPASNDATVRAPCPLRAPTRARSAAAHRPTARTRRPRRS